MTVLSIGHAGSIKGPGLPHTGEVTNDLICHQVTEQTCQCLLREKAFKQALEEEKLNVFIVKEEFSIENYYGLNLDKHIYILKEKDIFIVKKIASLKEKDDF